MANAIDESVTTNAAINQKTPVSEVEYQTTPCQVQNPKTKTVLASALFQNVSGLVISPKALSTARTPIKAKFRSGNCVRKKLKLVTLATPSVNLV